MTRSRRTGGALHQRGWAGMLLLLLSLVLVGFLARALLKQMGVTERAETPVISSGPGKGTQGSTPPAEIAPLPAGAAASGAALERARAFDAQVQQQAKDAAVRIDAATK